MEKNKNPKKIKNHLLIFTIFFLVFIFSVLSISNGKSSIMALENSNKTPYTEAIPSVSIESKDYSSTIPGSWHIDKSAKWTSADTAKVTFDVKSVVKEKEISNYKDVILVLDSSGSMSGSKIEKVKSDAIQLVENLLLNNNNKVALVTFATSSNKILDLTNDKETVKSKINAMVANGNTNYNAALKNVQSIMKNYKYENNRDLIVLFLTDGYPCEDTPNQVGTYQLLKSKYPNMIVNGVQYEMGSSIKKELKEVSDNQWIANMETLNNILFEAVPIVNPVKYEKYEIVDYVDKNYFVLNSEDDIEVTVGTVKLEEENGLQKIIWTLGEIATGFDAKMNMNLQLKEQYIDSKGFYSTNNNEKVIYTLENEEKTVNSDKTPVLEKKQYKVIYDINSPKGTTVDKTENLVEEHFPWVKVNKKTNTPTIKGYNFKCWEIATAGVKELNENTFEMPEEDVTIRATWTKQGITKRMDGTVATKAVVKVGDTVNYSPNGTYQWDKELATGHTGIENLNSKSGETFNISTWKVLSVDEDGNVELVPSKPTTGTVNLGGAQGYNNAVYLLNEACSKLYGNESKNIIARSINEEDFVKAGGSNWTNFKESYTHNNVKYGEQGFEYTFYKYYPSIYAQENKSVIDNKENKKEKNPELLDQSEQKNLIKVTGNELNPGYLQAQNSIKPYQTYYNTDKCDKTKELLGEKATILLPYGSSTRYWVASRCVRAEDSSSCSFNIFYVIRGYLGAINLGNGHGSGSNVDYALFPVISLSSELLEFEKDNGDGSNIFKVE